jgi:hypothetical protein
VKCGLALEACASVVAVWALPFLGSWISVCGEERSQIPFKSFSCQPQSQHLMNSLPVSNRISSRRQQI